MNEATLRIYLQIRKNNIDYRSYPQAYSANVAGNNGPTPGSVLISTSVTDINLSQLVTPGLCRIQNMDTVNFVEWGTHNLVTNVFSPLGEILPGESYVIRLSRFLGKSLPIGSGTGTISGSNIKFAMKADYAPCICKIEAFDA